MKIIVAGSRTYTNHQYVYTVLDSVIQRSDIVMQGGAQGVDQIAATWCRTHHVACREFKAEWEVYGKAAGTLRNAFMAHDSDALIAFWDGSSPGTGDMIRCMQRAGKPIFYARYDSTEDQEGLDMLREFV